MVSEALLGWLSGNKYILRKKFLSLENKTLCPQKFEKHAR